MENVAAPPLTVAVPNTVAPSRNCTVPVAKEGTCAVNVTAWPTVDGFAEEVSVTVDITFSTSCATAAEVLALKFPSPL